MEQQERYYLLSESQLKELFDAQAMKCRDMEGESVLNAPYPDLPEALSITSDEEIETYSLRNEFHSSKNGSESSGIHQGATWMRDKILNQSKK